MYYLGFLLLFLSYCNAQTIDYTTAGSIVAVYGSQNGAFVITSGDSSLQFYWFSPTATITCKPPSSLSLAISTVMFDVLVDGDNMSMLLLSANRLYIVTFIYANGVCTGQQDWTDTLMKGKPIAAYFLPASSASGSLFAYCDTKRTITFASYAIASGSVAVGWSQAMSLIDVDATVGIPNGPVADLATPTFYYDSAADIIIFLDKSGKVYRCDVSIVRKNSSPSISFTQIVYNPDTSVKQVFDLWLEPKLQQFMLGVSTSSCDSAVAILGYKSPGAVIFDTFNKTCTTRLPLSDGGHFYYQDSSLIYVVDSTTSTVFFTATNGTVVDDYKFISEGKALVITKHLDTLECNMYIVEGSSPTPFSTIPFLASDLFQWEVIYDGTGNLRGVLFWTNVATVYGYGFGDTAYEVTLALDNPKDYTVVTLLSEDSGIAASKSYLGIEEGSDQGYELVSTIFWDYSTLALPIPVNKTTVAFIFSDFIIALTRVKNEVTTIFQSYIDLGDVTQIDNWSPSKWSETAGMSLNITFTLGETPAKITSVLTSMANEIGVTVERECEFQDFLQCDSFVLTQHYVALNTDTTTTGGPGIVTFLVNDGRKVFGVSSVLGMLVVLLYTLVSL